MNRGTTNGSDESSLPADAVCRVRVAGELGNSGGIVLRPPAHCQPRLRPTTRHKFRCPSGLRELPRLDSNQERGNQNPLCCQLHHGVLIHPLA